MRAGQNCPGNKLLIGFSLLYTKKDIDLPNDDFKKSGLAIFLLCNLQMLTFFVISFNSI